MFECQPFGSHLLKGIDTPLAVYHVQSERHERRQPLAVAVKTTLTPLVGREQEVGLLIDRWEQAKEGRGQVVLLSGEAGHWQITLGQHTTRARHQRRLVTLLKPAAHPIINTAPCIR